MSRNHFLSATLFAFSISSGTAFAASELEQMRATLADMQKLLQQQQARIEQLERQVGERTPDATKPASSLPVSSAPAETAASRTPTAGLASLYGRIDLFAEADWGGSRGSRTALESGGMNGSRVGLKGGLDLGSEARLIYQLETGFFANNGRLGQSGDGYTRIFGRQAYVGVEGKLGKLTLGRQYSPYFMETIRFDAFENGYGSPTNGGNVKPGPTRYDNAVIYSSPKYAGFTGSGMLAQGGKTGGTTGNAYALTVDYAEGPLGLGISYLYDNHNGNETQHSNYAYAGGRYQIGRVGLMGGMGGVDTVTDAGVARADRGWFVGSRIDVTSSGQLWLIHGQGRNRLSVIDDRSRIYSLAWMETLNQQLKAYLAYARNLNNAGSALAPSGTSAYGYYSVAAGDNANGLALGIQYVF